MVNTKISLKANFIQILYWFKIKDDEEYATSSVILENLSGSARTDYKSNHVYIERYKLNQKKKKSQLMHTINKFNVKMIQNVLKVSNSLN